MTRRNIIEPLGKLGEGAGRNYQTVLTAQNVSFLGAWLATAKALAKLYWLDV